MGIKFPVGIGTILLCDYSRGGFQPPEMVKRRPAIVISPRLPHRDGLCTVVPISADQPDHDVDYVVRLEFDPPLPEPFSYNEEQRKKYFLGGGDEIDPVGVSGDSDTRRIEIPEFGIVTIADWKWIPSDIHVGAHSAQWVQLIGLELTNPGSGGGAGAGGGGRPSGG